MAWPDDMFDLVFNEGIPQHWTEDEKRQKCINEMMRVTKPGGTVIIIGNNGLNPEEQKIDQSFQFKYEGMPPTRKCFTPEELKSRMAVAGLLDVKVAILGPHLNTATLIGGYGRKS
jgi:ubiquinone/menaquinone biosynthesis C-methylase UbiE